MQERTRARLEQALVVVLGLLLTGLVTGASYLEAAKDSSDIFAGRAEAVVAAIVEQINLGVTAAEATRGLIVASEEVTAQEFADFVEQLQVSERFPELSAVVYTTVIPADATQALEERISSMTGSPFTVVPSTPVQAQRWVVTFVHPLEGNQAALGADLLVDPPSRQAGTQAVTEVAPTMTGPVDLGEALGGGQTGLGVLVPVLRDDVAAGTMPDAGVAVDVQGRREHLIGFTSIFFRGDDLLHAVLDQQDDLTVSVYDRAVTDEQQAVVGTFAPDGPPDAEPTRTMHVDTEVFDRPWRVTVSATQGHGVPLALPLALGSAGLAVTVVLALLLGSVRGSERRAQALADAATDDLARVNRALAQANTDLARANDDLADSNANLQRSNLELSRFAHVASHDLKQPVQLVISFTELLKDLLTSRLGTHGLDEMERTALDRIEQAALRMRTLIDDVLTLAGADRGPEQMGQVEVTGALQQVLELMGPRIDRLGASVEVLATDPVIMDPRQIGPLLQNLIDNALKFRRPDVVPTVRISAVDRGRDWVLEVADNGIGIPLGDRPGVFQAFRRLHSQDDHEGSGVGLAICAAVVEGHGGSIRISDGIDGGSRFVVRLPQPPQAPGSPGYGLTPGGMSVVG